MDPVTLLAPLGLAAGVNLYLTVLVIGMATRFEWAAQVLPDSFDVFGSWPVLAVAAVMTLVEFVADKVPYVDNLWDTVHTFIRPLGAVLIAVNILPDGDPGVTTALALLTGAGALTSHASKAGLRAMVNTSPEPFSNIALSVVEDVSVVGLMALAFEYPIPAAVIALIILVLLVVFLVWLVRFARRMFGSVKRFLRAGSGDPAPAAGS